MKYQYDRKGALSDIPHISLAPGIFIIAAEDLKVFKPFRKYARIESREIALTAADVKALKKTGGEDES